MTVQWIGDNEKDGLTRPVWYAKDRSEEWRSLPSKSRKFPLTDQSIFRTELTGLEPDTDYRFRVGLDSAEQRFRTMPAKATNTIHFVSGGDSGVGKHAISNNHVAAAQVAAVRSRSAATSAYENGKNPAIFYQYIKNYARDLKDDKGRLIPMLACIGNHEVDGGYQKPRASGSVLLRAVRRAVYRHGLRKARFWRLSVDDLSRHRPHHAGQRAPDRLAGGHAQGARGIPDAVCLQSRAGVPLVPHPCLRRAARTRGSEPTSASIGARYSNDTTSTPSSNTTTTRSNARIRCWTGV